mgnify:CR=1 FL=1
MKKISQKNAGYTIIETMISVSLFIIITVAGMGALLSANFVHKKSQDMRSIMDNLNFVMEDISRNLRTGYNYRCYNISQSLTGDSAINISRSCGNGWALAFEHTFGNPNDNIDQWVYFIGGDGKIYKSTNNAVGGIDNFVQLTPNEIIITGNVDGVQVSGFSVLGAEPPPGNSQQPFVIIKLVGKITFKDVVTPFSLQTSISQRLIDI